MSSVFWDDLAKDMQDPAFAREFIIESIRIANIDAIINALDEARVSAGLSKAALARAIGAEPATVRRLFSANRANPTVGTLAEVAAALGLRISVEPLPEREPPANRLGGAVATATSTAENLARTFAGHDVRKSRPGIDSARSSSR